MATDRTAFAVAVGTYLEPRVADRLHDAWRATAPQPQTDETDAAAGLALAVAMSGLPAHDAAKQIQALGLYEVQLHELGLTLGPLDAARHPLLAPWLAHTFADMVGEVVSAGRIGANIGAAAPLYDSLNMTAENGVIGNGLARLVFPAREGTVTADLRFGRPVAGRFGHVTVISGDALFGVGFAMRGVPPMQPPAPDQARAAPDGGALH